MVTVHVHGNCTCFDLSSKGLGVNRLKVIIAVDRIRTEVYQHPTNSDLLDHMGC